MNARRLVAIGALLLLAGWNIAGAASVTWISGETPPRDWTVEPAAPTPADVITFSGPTTVYTNVCEGQKDLGGVPQLLIDSTSKIVLLWFQGPVGDFCTKDYTPVAGLQGEFGPLEAGDWTFTCLSRSLPFTIQFTVGERSAGLYVDADSPGPAHNGTSWAKAFLTLQDALAAVRDGQVIFVAEGTYTPDQGSAVTPGDRAATFTLTNGIVVQGGYAGYGQPNPDERDIAAHATVLSGDLNGDDGRGVLNRAENSFHVVTGPAAGQTATLDGFSIINGQANGAFPNHLGAGLYHAAGTLSILNCTFQGNTAAFGGAILNQGAALTMVNVQLVGNRAFASGGGLYNYEGGATLHNCRIVGNSADNAEIMGGSAIDNLNGTVTLRDCTVADNLSPNGRAISSFSWNSTVAPTVDVANSILYNGGDEISSNNLGAVSVTYSDVQGGWPGTGNIDADPQFVAPGSFSIEGEWTDGDYRLGSRSPCIDVGDDRSLPPDVLDLNGNADLTEPLPLDLDSQARVAGRAVDLGAYEWVAGTVEPPSIDLIVDFGAGIVHLAPDSHSPNVVIGSSTFDAEMTFKSRITAVVTAATPAGGTWTGWLDPEIIGPGVTRTTLWIRGENLDYSALPAGSPIEVATIQFYAAPVP